MEVGKFVVVAVVVSSVSNGFFIGGQCEVQLVEFDESIGKALSRSAAFWKGLEGFVECILRLFFSSDAQV